MVSFLSLLGVVSSMMRPQYRMPVAHPVGLPRRTSEDPSSGFIAMAPEEGVSGRLRFHALRCRKMAVRACTGRIC